MHFIFRDPGLIPVLDWLGLASGGGGLHSPRFDPARHANETAVGHCIPFIYYDMSPLQVTEVTHTNHYEYLE